MLVASLGYIFGVSQRGNSASDLGHVEVSASDDAWERTTLATETTPTCDGPYSRRMELDTSRTMEEDGGKQEVPADEIVFSVMNISLKLCNFDNLGLQGDFFVVNRC